MTRRLIFSFMILILLLASANIMAQRFRQVNLEKPPLPKDEAEKRIMEVTEELAAYRGRMQNVPPEDGRLLRLFAEATEAKHVVEIGTSNGYSALWISMALIKTGGKLTTFEIDPDRIKMARENFKKAGVEDIITIVEGDAHENVKNLEGPIDMVFLDADKSGYPDYLDKLLPLVRAGGLIMAHNMRSPMPDPDYIKAITTDPNLDTIFLHMQGAGMAVTLKKH
ncbi:methyltransferase [Candidatus Poribacteria bacterium]|nr:methyltransferase [Candidatus Poribacteria bacterium]